MVITRWSSTDSVTPTTVHVSPFRTSVSPKSGIRPITAYSQAPDVKRIVIVSEATGRLPLPNLARCQVGTARGRAVGSGSTVADFVLFKTLCFRVAARRTLVLSPTASGYTSPTRLRHSCRPPRNFYWLSSRSLSLCMFWGISRFACLLTTSGRRSFPIP